MFLIILQQEYNRQEKNNSFLSIKIIIKKGIIYLYLQQTYITIVNY